MVHGRMIERPQRLVHRESEVDFLPPGPVAKLRRMTMAEVSRAVFLGSEGVAVAPGSEDRRRIPGLTMSIVMAGASPRAKVGDVAEPRCAGSSRQGSSIFYTFQIDSRNGDEFYTISIATHGPISSASDVEASCSCPFSATQGWCKHAVKCLAILVDDNADDEQQRKRPLPSFDDDAVSPLKKTRRQEKKKKKKMGHPAREERCARCGATFVVGGDGGLCVMSHPRQCVENERCRRCGRSTTEDCFRGPHESSLVVVDAEAWPESSDDDDVGT